MSDMIDLVRVLTAATGNSTPITLGAKYSNLFMTPAEAGAVDGRTYTYLIVDGTDFELGKGAYTASGTTLARTNVLFSRISGTMGTSRITLSGTAQVRFIQAAEDMGSLRGTRTVTGATDAIAQNDTGRAIEYNRATAIAVSIAQAGTSSLFLDGWCAWVTNIGAGSVTITPATSTINAASTLVITQNVGAFIWSDGTNYRAVLMPLTKPLLAANNLSDIPTPATALTNLSAIGYTSQSLSTAQRAVARANISAALRGHLWGLTLSAAGSTGTFGIAAGEAADSTNLSLMVLGSAYTKGTGSWVVGSGNGAMDTSSVANNTWYHVHLIQRVDTGVVDVLFSLSATAPTLPANYTLFRRIGSMKTNSSAQWIKFNQLGDEFLWDVPVNENSGAAITVGTSAVDQTLTVATGVQVWAKFNLQSVNTASTEIYVTAEDQANSTPDATHFNFFSSGTAYGFATYQMRTDTSARVRIKGDRAASSVYITSEGWIDTRGRLY